MALFRLKKPGTAGLARGLLPLAGPACLVAYAPLNAPVIQLNREAVPVASEPSGLAVCIFPPPNFREEEQGTLETGFISYLLALGHQVYLWEWLSETGEYAGTPLAQPFAEACQLMRQPQGETLPPRQLAFISWGRMVDALLSQLPDSVATQNELPVVMVDADFSGKVMPAWWNGLSRSLRYRPEELTSPLLSIISQGSSAALVPKTANLFERAGSTDMTLELVPTRSASVLGDAGHLYPAWYLIGEWLRRRIP